MALIGANVLSLPRPFVVAAYVLVGIPLLLVALGFASARFWPATVTYLVAALATMAVAMVTETTDDRDPRPIRALAVTIAVSSIGLSGVLIPSLLDASPQMYSASGLFGLLFLAAGGAVLIAHAARVGPRWLGNAAVMTLGAVYVTFALLVQVRTSPRPASSTSRCSARS